MNILFIFIFQILCYLFHFLTCSPMFLTLKIDDEKHYELSQKRKEEQDMKNKDEGKRLVARGTLSYNLYRLRSALGIIFIPSYWQGQKSEQENNSKINKNNKWSLLINRDLRHGSAGRLRRFLYHNNTIKSENSTSKNNISEMFSPHISTVSYFHFFLSFLSSIFGQIDTSLKVEYKAVVSDLLVLASPDFEISGARKIATAVRMRNTYRCLIPPKI